MVVLLGCVGCVAVNPRAEASRTGEPAPSTTIAPAPTATEPPPAAIVPDGTAEENLPIFASVVNAVWATPAQVTGLAYIDALAAAGFDRATMELTPDVSTVGNPAESIQFSVRWIDECLIGQVGPATGGPVAIVAPVLAEGRCLIGETVPVNE